MTQNVNPPEPPVLNERVMTQAEVTEVRPLDLVAAQEAVRPVVEAERQAERWPDSERDRLEREIERLRGALQGAVAAKDREIEGFKKSMGRLPKVMPEWLEKARAALQERHS